MLNLESLYYHDLPYVPLPETARNAALDNASKQGFTPLEDYNLFSLGENQPIKTNILAFAHPVHRTPEYTGLTVFNAANGHDDSKLVSLLATSGAPFHLIHRDGEFSFWICPVLDKIPTPRVIENHISYDQLDNALSEYEVDLRPQRIIDVKQGRDTFTLFRDIQPLQLSIWASEVTADQLVKHFAATVTLLREEIDRRTKLQHEEKDILVTTISIQLLGATILSDTGVLGEEMRLNRPSLDALMHRASNKFERYFKYDLFINYYLEAERAYQLIQKICYAGFIPDMLRELYRAAYSEKERKESGSYDTPLYLTRQIWKNIPIEYLPPQKRTFADMACGWGSFLVAGHERLSGLKDMKDIVLREQLYGNDNSSFTAQLAGLGLLLSTSEDSWNVNCNDVLSWQWLQEHQPAIIVGNPPFGGDRKQTLESASSSTEKARQEKANSFLRYAIGRLAPSGYLAMIMPRSFTVGEASPELRQQLLEACDVLELWELPTEAFSGPTQRTIVIFAQKKAEHRNRLQTPVRLRTIQSHTLDAFKTGGVVTASGLVVNQEVWNERSRKSVGSKNDHLMDYSLILPEYTWKTIQAYCTNLSELAEIMRGAIVGQKPENKRWTDYPHPKQVPWLTGIKNIMPLSRPFFIDYAQARTILYPNGLEEPRKNKKNPAKDKEHILAGIKVLIPYDINPSWGKQVRIAIERRGYFVSDHFYVVVPKSTAQSKHISHEVLAAVLNWEVSNAWVVEHLKSPAIPKRVVDSIPFPKDLSEKDCNTLTQAILQLEAAAHANQPEPIEATHTIDLILKRAYHLDEATFTRLRQVKEWGNTPQITLDPQPNSDEANWLLSGGVDSVDAEVGTITLFMSGFDELQKVQIAPSMPGWMLRPNAAFRTKIPRKYIKNGMIDANAIDWGAFHPQHYTYMSEEELFAELAKILHTDDKHKV